VSSAHFAPGFPEGSLRWKFTTDLPFLFDQAVPFTIRPRVADRGLSIRLVDSASKAGHPLVFFGVAGLVLFILLCLLADGPRCFSHPDRGLTLWVLALFGPPLVFGVLKFGTRKVFEMKPAMSTYEARITKYFARQQSLTGNLRDCQLSIAPIEVNYGSWERPHFWHGYAAHLQAGQFSMVLACTKTLPELESYVTTLPSDLRQQPTAIGPPLRSRGGINLW
jgi:hypothetical protein